ncbi:MAG: diaminopropionate ammonia-lyase [Pseudomonadota bacterium]
MTGEPFKSADGAVEIVLNANAAARGDPVAGPLTPDGFKAAAGEITSWDHYCPTPLTPLPDLAAQVGVGALHYKDEAGRFGLSSFKPLGAAYASARAVARVLETRGHQGIALSALLSGDWAQEVGEITLVSATDGNHGRAVAWGARRVGARAKIFTHDQMSGGRREAIKALGAEVIICAGGYDDAVREAFRAGEENGWPVVQDTSLGDYRDVPIDISHGYGLIAQEAIEALEAPPTHAIVQAGVGGVASAICARFWQHYGPERPKFIVLEPQNAACVARSLEAGKRVTLHGDTHSAMAGLACGEVSEVAWDVLRTGADAAIILEDDWAFQGMRRLADPAGADPPVVAGECAGGAIGALLALQENPHLKAALGLDERARVFVLGTEGATDPAIYQSVVGRPAETVAPAHP